MIDIWAELQGGETGGSWIGRNIVWLYMQLPSFLPVWAKLVLLFLPVWFLSACIVFWSVRNKSSENREPVLRQLAWDKDASAVVRLRPNLTRIFISIDSFLLIVFVFRYFQQGYMDGKWWTMDYIYSFSVPLIIVPLLVWFIFVPRILEYSQNHIRVVTILRESLEPWSQVKSYGYGTGIFTLRFKHKLQGCQIWSSAYSNSDWSQFIDYLESRSPNRES